MNKIQYAKNMIRSYHYNRQQVQYLQNELQRLDAMLTRIKTPKLGELTGTYISPLEIFDEQDNLNQRLNHFNLQIKAVERFFECLEDKDTKLIKCLYFANKRYCDVCYEVYMSEKTLKRYVDKLIKDYFEI